ncbi:MAG TPA: hypothetical protein VHM26_01285 [Chitinophagaceae bacterium]|jgi:hypothetical protein|nr:hypothetical protein [Chitinophagaceae bacterium]
MKKIISSLSLILIIITAAAQSSCDKCLFLRGSLFDADVKVSKPSGDALAWEYTQLSWPAKFANTYIFNNDPSRSCWLFIDAGFLNGKATTADQPAPAGDMTGTTKFLSEELSYLVTSTVTGTGDNSRMVMELQTACDRKTIARSEVAFSWKDKPGALQKAGEQAAAQLMPLRDKVMEYARNLRETDTRYMLGGHGREIKIKPAKTKLGVGEVTDVEIQVIDCDGYLLKNREVSFTRGSINGFPVNGTEGGIVTPSRVTTDDQGKAKVKFKLTRADGTATIYAHFSGLNPSGCPDVVFGSAPIGNIPVQIELSYMYHSSQAINADINVLHQKQTQLNLQNSGYKRHNIHLLYYAKQPLKNEFSLSIPAKEGETPVKVKYLRDEGVYYTRDDATGNLSTLAIGNTFTGASAAGRLRTGNSDSSKHTYIKLDWNETDLAELQLEFSYVPKGGGYLNDPMPDTYFFRSSKGAGFVKNKITDKNSPYKSEYLITLNRVDKLSDPNALGTVMVYGGEISEEIRLRILTPYE